MKYKIYLRGDLTAKFRISQARLAEMEKLKLIRPAGFTEDKEPVYSEEAFGQLAHIQKLQDLGYGLEEISKIVKKVGLPKTESGKSGQEKPDSYLTVGTLAEKIGVSPRTIKHWEDVGIIVPEMRSEGGFRLYPEIYVYLCNLVKDLQLFGYSLEEIKTVSDYFRDFLDINADPKIVSRKEVQEKLDSMAREIDALFDKMELFKKGIARWEDLLKKKKKEILQLKGKSPKKQENPEGKKNA
jgi:DNA-binding transcriptional MerR regulator